MASLYDGWSIPGKVRLSSTSQASTFLRKFSSIRCQVPFVFSAVVLSALRACQMVRSVVAASLGLGAATPDLYIDTMGAEAASLPTMLVLVSHAGSLHWPFVYLLVLLLFPLLFPPPPSTGAAFTYPMARLAFGATCAAYVHYPTISTDMLRAVYERRPSYNHASAIASSSVGFRTGLALSETADPLPQTSPLLSLFHGCAWLHGSLARPEDAARPVKTSHTRLHIPLGRWLPRPSFAITRSSPSPTASAAAAVTSSW